MPRCRQQSHTWEEFDITVDGNVVELVARWINPFRDRVVGLSAGVVKLLLLHKDSSFRKEPIATAMVEVEMSVDNYVDTVEIEPLLIQRLDDRLHVFNERMQFSEPGVNEDAASRVIDNVHVNRHFDGAELADFDWRDGYRLGVIHGASTDNSKCEAISNPRMIIQEVSARRLAEPLLGHLNHALLNINKDGPVVEAVGLRFLQNAAWYVHKCSVDRRRWRLRSSILFRT